MPIKLCMILKHEKLLHLGVMHHAVGQQQRAERRRYRECRQQPACQRISIGARHRSENVTFYAAEREERNERGEPAAFAGGVVSA